MHELSVAHALVDAVVAAVGDQAGRVTEVHVRVGALSGVVRPALEFAYDVAADGTPLAGSRLVVVECPAVVHCSACGNTSTLADHLRFVCPVCGELTGDVRGGSELDVSHVVLDDEDDDGAGHGSPSGGAGAEVSPAGMVPSSSAVPA